jgi:hypothetical protein
VPPFLFFDGIAPGFLGDRRRNSHVRTVDVVGVCSDRGRQVIPDGGETLVLARHRSIRDIPAAAWDACAGASNPFVSHGFLRLLEDSGSVQAKTGWLPQHLTLADGNGTLVACAPLYLKSHSYGEYVFDWSWAEAFERAGGRYYPKLQASVPFTPVTGPRLLVRPGAPPGTGDVLAQGMLRVAQQLGVSSLHVTFQRTEETDLLERLGFLPRLGHQYHWTNRGYGSFNDFLGDLASRKRKSIRKERALAAGHGIALRPLTGADIEERHWDAFHRFYLDTVERKWAHAYLTRDFFLGLGEHLADRVMLVIAETAEGRPVGGALNLIGDDALYGRYWGCEAAYRFLHFEACYYRAIDFAIERGLARVEAGAQGEHKIQRGYLPQRTSSAHWIADPDFRAAVRRFLEAERPAVEREIGTLATLSPFRSGDDGCARQGTGA